VPLERRQSRGQGTAGKKTLVEGDLGKILYSGKMDGHEKSSSIEKSFPPRKRGETEMRPEEEKLHPRRRKKKEAQLEQEPLDKKRKSLTRFV